MQPGELFRHDLGLFASLPGAFASVGFHRIMLLMETVNPFLGGFRTGMARKDFAGIAFPNLEFVPLFKHESHETPIAEPEDLSTNT